MRLEASPFFCVKVYTGGVIVARGVDCVTVLPCALVLPVGNVGLVAWTVWLRMVIVVLAFPAGEVDPAGPGAGARALDSIGHRAHMAIEEYVVPGAAHLVSYSPH